MAKFSRRNIFVRRSDVLRLAVPVAVRPQLEPAANQSEANLWANRYLAEKGLL